MTGAAPAPIRRTTQELCDENLVMARSLKSHARAILNRLENPLQPASAEGKVQAQPTINGTLSETNCDLMVVDKLLAEILAVLGEPRTGCLTGSSPERHRG